MKLLEDNKIQFDFLGKDSMRYLNTVQVTPLVYSNFKYFLENKEDKNNIFEEINSSKLNEYL